MNDQQRPDDDDAPLTITERQRRDIHLALDRWLAEVQRNGQVRHENGVSGECGRFEAHANVDYSSDTGFALSVVRLHAEEI